MTIRKSSKTTVAAAPDRDDLAAAQAAVRDARTGVQRARNAEARAAAAVTAAEAEVQAAEAAVAAAKAQHVAQIAGSARTGKAAGGSALKSARARLTDGQDELDAAREAYKKLQGDLNVCHAELHRATVAVEPAAAAALQPAALKLLDEIETAWTELVKKKFALRFLYFGQKHDAPVFIGKENHERAEWLLLGTEYNNLPAAGSFYNHPRKVLQDAAEAPWREALAALAADPNAKLPL